MLIYRRVICSGLQQILWLCLQIGFTKLIIAMLECPLSHVGNCLDKILSLLQKQQDFVDTVGHSYVASIDGLHPTTPSRVAGSASQLLPSLSLVFVLDV